jgi:hypothetical protein
VIGGVNHRLDFELLECVSRIAALGTLLFVGPVAKESREDVQRLQRASNKVLFLGSKPRDELPAWMQLLDVALIPYRATEFNRFCSPMRLFDHLASSRSIVATTACPQISEFSPPVVMGGDAEFLRLTEAMLTGKSAPKTCDSRITWQARGTALAERLQTLMKD